MTRLLIIPLLLALTSCVGADSDKPDSSDSAPLIADEKIIVRSAVRCADVATAEECYAIDTEGYFTAQPGEHFGAAGVEGCPTGPEAELLMYASFGSPDADGAGVVRVDLAFDCGESEPVDGHLFTAEEWVIGDAGTVLRLVLEADFVAD